MASDASHALEAALEQMDGIIAGTGREPYCLLAHPPHLRNCFLSLLFLAQREAPR